jgi:hypothetical protein
MDRELDWIPDKRFALSGMTSGASLLRPCAALAVGGDPDG